jgi:hypothetical protein
MTAVLPTQAIDTGKIEAVPLRGHAGEEYPAIVFGDLVFLRYTLKRGLKDNIHLVVQRNDTMDIGNGVVVYFGRLDLFDQEPTYEDIAARVASEPQQQTAFVALSWRYNFALLHFGVGKSPSELSETEFEELLSQCRLERDAKNGRLALREDLTDVVDDGFGVRLPGNVATPEEAQKFVTDSRPHKERGGFEWMSVIWPIAGEATTAFMALERFYDHCGFKSELKQAPVFKLRNGLGTCLFRLWPVEYNEWTKVMTCSLYPGGAGTMEVKLTFCSASGLLGLEFVEGTSDD